MLLHLLLASLTIHQFRKINENQMNRNRHDRLVEMHIRTVNWAVTKRADDNRWHFSLQIKMTIFVVIRIIFLIHFNSQVQKCTILFWLLDELKFNLI